MCNRAWALAVLLSGLLSACATSRGIVDIKAPPTVNPQAGPAVKVVAVNDRRVFELKPAMPSIPSLRNGEINDPSITSRAIARKRNGYGKALGDILLPEQRTVAQLAGDTLTGALRRAGYRVLAPADPEYASAAPIEADVNQFWAWMNPGFWTVSVEFEASVSLRGALPSLAGPVQVRGHHQLKTGAAGTKAWVAAIDAGISDLKSNLALALSAGVAPGAPATAAPAAATSAAASSGGEAPAH